MMLLQIIWHFTRGMFERVALVKVALLITLFYCFPKDQSIYAQGASTKTKADFYAEISSERDSLVVGDSCLVSVVLYANLPFESVEQKPRNIVFPKDVHVTPIQTDRTQQQVHTARGVYYALVWQHYRVSRKDVGRIVCPEHLFTAELGIYQAVGDGFLDFFCTFDALSRETQSHLQNSQILTSCCGTSQTQHARNTTFWTTSDVASLLTHNSSILLNNGKLRNKAALARSLYSLKTSRQYGYSRRF